MTAEAAMPGASEPLSADVVIIGSGMGGSTTALALARRGISVLVLERGMLKRRIHPRGMVDENPWTVKRPGIRGGSVPSVKDGVISTKKSRHPSGVAGIAVRIVRDNQHTYGSQWDAICSIAAKLGPKPQTVRLWVRQDEIDNRRQPELTSDEEAELKALVCRVQARERDLKAAAHFFGAELDRHSQK
jgi:transposase